MEESTSVTTSTTKSKGMVSSFGRTVVVIKVSGTKACSMEKVPLQRIVALNATDSGKMESASSGLTCSFRFLKETEPKCVDFLSK